ncbi:MAG: hypothetical protein AAFQ95_24730 [Cyanobacteria bacterium J06621_3]
MNATISERKQQPCNNCPFRSDIDFWLTPEKVEAIVKALQGDGDFCCHKTTAASSSKLERKRACVGAAIFLEHVREGGLRANRTFRMREMFCHDFSREALDMNAPVFKTVEAFTAARVECVEAK